ncbi:MAG TPA: hypothetical protein VKC66_00445 [Xanthobacteraceae bacterium]|nr:hypothetical protein [Xanthobacteraceae bacterium]
MVGDFGERDPDAALVLLEHFSKSLAFYIEHDALARELETFQLVVVWKDGDRFIVEINHVAQIYDWVLNRLVLAKLPVCRLQIGKIDAMELVVLAAKRARIVHCSVDEIIEVYILDLEGLDHMGAAGVEQFRHLLLIPIATEFCLHCLRGCRHLAKRQSRTKNFDEKPFHPGAPFRLPQSLSRLVGAPWFGERWGKEDIGRRDESLTRQSHKRFPSAVRKISLGISMRRSLLEVVSPGSRGPRNRSASADVRNHET